MAMQQLYYTSCLKGISGSAGFQVKAVSPGMPTDVQVALNKILGYRIPPALDVDNVPSHPIALRYQYLNAEVCLLLCSQSNGPDEGGRPGNFFAHCIVTSPNDFDILAPIMYWRHSFWKTTDGSNSLVIPPEPSFELEPSLEFETIWPFLAEGSRQEYLYRLLCAVLRYDEDMRRVVILDTTDNIALWIAAATFALPGAYRRFISFATYHHDPYGVPFLITGTTADSRFRFSSDEYISYFVLNAPQNRVSDVKDSVYAQFVSRYMHPETYETKLIGFFEYCSDRLQASPQRLAEQLDTVTNLYLAVREKSLPVQNPTTQASLRFLLSNAEQQETLPEEYLDDLTSTCSLCQEALLSAPNQDLMENYLHALRLLRRHDKNFCERCGIELDFTVQLILQENEILLGQFFPVLQELFPSSTLAEAVSQPRFLDSLITRLPQGRSKAYQLLWQHLGPVFRTEEPTTTSLKPFVLATFELLDSMGTQATITPTPTPAADALLSALDNATRGSDKQKVLLDGLIEWGGSHPGPAFHWVYCLIVGKLPLDKRDKYRSYITRQNRLITPEMLIAVEIEHDVRAVSPDRLLPLLETWMLHIERWPAPQAKGVMTQAVNLIWPTIENSNQISLSGGLLASRLLDYLDGPLVSTLVSIYFSRFQLGLLDSGEQDLVERFVDHTVLSSDQRAILEGSLAMTKGKFGEQAVPEIRNWLSKLDQSQYKQEAQKLIVCFFMKNISLDGHIEMLQATYNRQHQAEFWDIYWTYFRNMLLNKDNASRAIDMLSFWFDEALPVFGDQPYLGPSFFLQLPSVLEELCQEKEFRPLAERLAKESTKLPWYVLLHAYLTPTLKKGLFSFFKK